MKTADLIPLILFELDECDKYGFELTKNIETKSKGKIVIKQPTLYTLLKKLEKSKFISSYWEDSEIGGKRHYYKITDNGRLQLTTLPSYQELIRLICSEDDSEPSFDAPTVNEDSVNTDEENISEDTTYSMPKSEDTQNIESLANIDQEKHISIMDALLEDNTPRESILPSEEVFSEDSIDTSTELEVNASNIDVLKEDVTKHAEEFAVNKEVAKFTEKIDIVTDEYKAKFNDIDLDRPFNITETRTKINDEPIKFVEYVDFKKSESYKTAKSTARKLVLKCFATSLYLIAMLTIIALACSKFGTTPLYYVSIISGVAFAIFYPIACLSRYERFRLDFQTNPYKYNLKKRLYIAIGVFLLVMIVSIVVNINSGINTMNDIMSIKNFANLYAPLLLSSALFADIVLSVIILRKKK